MQEQNIKAVKNSSLIAFATGLVAVIIVNSILPNFEKISFNAILSFIGTSATIFILPILIYDRSKWFTAFPISYSFIIVLFAFLGFSLGSFASIMGFIGLIFPLLYMLKLRKIGQFNMISSLAIILSFVVFLFLILMTYCTYHKIYYLQNAIMGKVHIDILFHSAICNSFDFGLRPSVMMDGMSMFKYHWGSHFVYNGIKNIIGISGFQMYNIGYPLIIVPLFIQSIVVVVNAFFEHNRFDKTFLSGLIFCFIAIYFSLDKFSYFGQPVGSESFTMSMIFSFFVLSLLFEFNKSSLHKGAISYLILLIVVTYFFKISTGLTLAAGLSYLLLKRNPKLITALLILICNLIVFALLYNSIFPNDRVTAHDSIIHRYHSFWKHSVGIFDYISGPLLLLFFVLIEQKSLDKESLKSIFASNKYFILEFLSVASIVGFLGGIAVSNHGNDILYFSGLQLYLCFPIFIVLIYKFLEKLNLSVNGKHIFLFVFGIFSLMSKPEAGKTLVDHISIHNETLEKKYPKVWGQLIMRLNELYFIENKNKYCIYIQKDESWFYNGLSKDDYPYRDEIESPFVVPGISGIPLISGIPDSVLNSDYPYYGVYYHRLLRKRQAVGIDEAIMIAKQEGFKFIITFTSINHTLKEEKIAIN